MAGLTVLADLGNSRFKWACWDGVEISRADSIEWAQPRSLQQMLDTWQQLDPDRIVVASVVDDRVNRSVSERVARAMRCELEYVKVPVEGYGVRVAYPDPDRLGVDRFVAMVGARSLVEDACLVVDCGTAVTIDALARDGQHLGGLIFPGIDLMRDSLVRGTAGIIDEATETDEPTLFATATDHAISSGAIRAVAAAIDRMCQDMETNMGCSVVRFLTGGDGGRLTPFLDGGYQHDPILIFKGLTVIAQG